MPLDERRARHSSLIKVLSKNDVRRWGDRFVAALQQPARVSPPPPREPAGKTGIYLAAAE